MQPANGQTSLKESSMFAASLNNKNLWKYFLARSVFQEEIYVSRTSKAKEDSRHVLWRRYFVFSFRVLFNVIAYHSLNERNKKNNLIKYLTSGYATCDDFWWNFIEYYSTHAALRCPTESQFSFPTLKLNATKKTNNNNNCCGCLYLHAWP